MNFGRSGLAVMEGGTGIERVENMKPIVSGITPPIKGVWKPRKWFDDDLYGVLETNVNFFGGLNWNSETTLNRFGTYNNSVLNRAKSGVMLGSILKTLASDPKLKLYIQIAKGNDSGQ